VSERTLTAPYTRGHPILGTALDLRKDIIGTLCAEWRKHGDLVRFRSPFAGVPDYLIAHPDHVQQVLQTQHKDFMHPPAQRQKFSDVVGQGLVASQGEYWRRQRRLSQPAFHRDAVASFAQVTVDTVADMADRWQAPARTGEIVDMRVEMMRVTLDVLARAMFGADWRMELERLGVHVTDMLERTFTAMLSPFAAPLWLPTPGNREFIRARAAVDDIAYNLIAASRRKLAAEGKPNLVQMLLGAVDPETGGSMSDEQVRDEIMAMLIAGHETVSTGLTWTWYLLSKYPEAEARVVAEVRAVCGDRPPTYADLAGLRYTTRAIQEAMRLYPPLWVIGRMPLVDVEIGGYLIAKDSVLLVTPYITHRHPGFWEDPESYDPDRFLPERSAGRHRYAYYPFGGGPRKCIGEGFAMMEMPLVVARVVQQYKLSLVPGVSVRPSPGISLRASPGMPMVVHNRHA
jgi:cytochrome P450